MFSPLPGEGLQIVSKVHLAAFCSYLHLRLPDQPRATELSGHCRTATASALHSPLHTSHSPLHTSHSTLHNLCFTLHTLHSTLHTSHSTLHTSHSTLHTLQSTLHIPHSTLHTLSTLHSTLHTPHSPPHSTLSNTLHHTPHSTHHTLHSTLRTPHSPLHTQNSTLRTPHSELHTPHSTLHNLHPTLNNLHSTLHTLHSTLHTSHSPLHTPNFTLCTPHFTLHTPHSCGKSWRHGEPVDWRTAQDYTPECHEAPRMPHEMQVRNVKTSHFAAFARGTTSETIREPCANFTPECHEVSSLPREMACHNFKTSHFVAIPCSFCRHEARVDYEMRDMQWATNRAPPDPLKRKQGPIATHSGNTEVQERHEPPAQQTLVPCAGGVSRCAGWLLSGRWFQPMQQKNKSMILYDFDCISQQCHCIRKDLKHMILTGFNKNPG